MSVKIFLKDIEHEVDVNTFEKVDDKSFEKDFDEIYFSKDLSGYFSNVRVLNSWKAFVAIDVYIGGYRLTYNGNLIYILRPIETEKDKKYFYCEDYEKKSVKGAYGKIKIHRCGKYVEKIFGEATKYGLRPDFLKELAVFNLFQKTNYLPKFYGFKLDPPRIYTELGVPIGLEGWTNEKRKNALRQLVTCLKVAKDNGIIHCDIKPDNIIQIGDRYFPIDWGISEVDFTPGMRQRKEPNVQTDWYRSPEVIANLVAYTCKIDIYSLGLIFLETFLGYNFGARFDWKKDLGSNFLRQLFPDLDEQKCNEKYFEELYWSKSRIYFDLVEKVVPEKSFAHLLSGMLQFNPNNRLTYEEILSHPTFCLGTTFVDELVKPVYTQKEFATHPCLKYLDEYTHDLVISSSREMFNRVKRKMVSSEHNYADILLTCLMICTKLYSCELPVSSDFGNKANEIEKYIIKKLDGDLFRKIIVVS